jgi:predicted metal-dependent hydrolase
LKTEHHSIEVDGIAVEVIRKDIKNLHLAVYPPDGRVRLSLPRRISFKKARLAIVTKLGWIRKQQTKFAGRPHSSPIRMISGESHTLWGQQYRLDVIERSAPPSIRIREGNILEMSVRPGTIKEKREALLVEWYREAMRRRIPMLINKWEPIVGIHASEWRIKRMKTRWGSCNIQQRRIWLNLELAKKPDVCLEYVLVHELVHLHERLHNDRFKSLMDRFMPGWRLHRDELKRSILGHDEMSC